MLIPVVKWYDGDNQEEQEGWDAGKIDIGSQSEETTFLIWNNRGGTEEASKMENCVITTKDLYGGNDLEAVANQYVHVCVVSAGETEFTPIGGEVDHPIKAAGDANEGEILGITNDGTKSGAPGNFAEIKLKIDLPSDATNGYNALLARVRYTYV